MTSTHRNPRQICDAASISDRLGCYRDAASSSLIQLTLHRTHAVAQPRIHPINRTKGALVGLCTDVMLWGLQPWHKHCIAAATAVPTAVVKLDCENQGTPNTDLSEDGEVDCRFSSASSAERTAEWLLQRCKHKKSVPPARSPSHSAAAGLLGCLVTFAADIGSCFSHVLGAVRCSSSGTSGCSCSGWIQL